jgi:hypothetical protein
VLLYCTPVPASMPTLSQNANTVSGVIGFAVALAIILSAP